MSGCARKITLNAIALESCQVCSFSPSAALSLLLVGVTSPPGTDCAPECCPGSGECWALVRAVMA